MSTAFKPTIRARQLTGTTARQASPNMSADTKKAMVYSDARWRRLRALVNQTFPKCVVCGAPSQLVDHIIPVTQDTTRAFDLRNVQPMCRACHDHKTQTIDAPGNRAAYRADRAHAADKRPPAMREWADTMVASGQHLWLVGDPSSMVRNSKRQINGDVTC